MRHVAVTMTAISVSAVASIALSSCTTPSDATAVSGRVSATTAGTTGVGTPSHARSAGPVPSVGPAPLVVETVFSHTTLDPTRQDERSGLLVAKALYETLTTYADDQSTVVPGLAEWSISPEGNWLTVRLRADAVFSDGTPVTSDDVIFTINRAQGIGGATAALLGTLNMTRVNDRTVTISAPDSHFSLPAILANPALGVLNADVVKAHGATIGPGDTAGAWLNSHSVGSGPYVLAATEPGRSITLTANPRWRGTPPHHREVVVRNASSEQQVRDVQSGAADVALDLSPSQADAVRLQPTVSSVSITTMRSSTIAFLLMNCDTAVSPWTSNRAFAEAVRRGLDLRDLALKAGGATPALGLIPVGITGAFEPSDHAQTPASPPPTSSAVPAPKRTAPRPPTAPPMSPLTPPPRAPGDKPTAAPVRDVVGAKQALARSGYAGQPISLTFAPALPIEGIPSTVVATEIRRQLGEVGITVRLAPAATTAALDSYRNGRNQLGLWSWSPDYFDPENYLAFGPGGTVGVRAGRPRGADPVVAEAAAEAQQAYGNERAAAYATWQQVMNERSPFVPLFQPASRHAHGDRVKGLNASPVWVLDLAAVG